jgi:hypothetical protein
VSAVEGGELHCRAFEILSVIVACGPSTSIPFTWLLKVTSRHWPKSSSTPGAAGSLRQGLVETFTVARLRVPPTLAPSLRSTNAVESMIEICRDQSTNVKRSEAGEMALRSCAAGMAEAKKQFRRINGRQHLKSLGNALSKHVGVDVTAPNHALDEEVAAKLNCSVVTQNQRWSGHPPAAGSVVIDRRAAPSGPPAADLTRTLLLGFQIAEAQVVGFTRGIRRHGFRQRGVAEGACDAWIRVVAAARLAEGFTGEAGAWRRTVARVAVTLPG